MAVRVRVLGDLRRFLDHEIVELDGGGCTLGAAFDQLTRRYPRLGKELFDEKGRLHYALVVMTGGRRATWPDDEHRLIEDGGELLLTRFHTGG